MLVIVSSLASGAGPFPLTLQARSALRPDAPHLDVEDSPALPHDPSVFDIPPIRDPTTAQPPLRRTFHLMVRDGDVASSRNYSAFDARLCAVGKRVQVYVADEDLGRVGDDVLRDLVQTFDDRVFPTVAGTLGQAKDVDLDGRFTIFLSSWLARMGQGQLGVDGFVRVADLDQRYSAPFGNRCDMMYLSADLGAGPHLRTVVAHEYTHAVLFSRKTLGSDRQTPSEVRVEEEGWLDEAIAHLSEDLHGFSRSNLDYRVSAFLSRPECYRLVVDDYYSANLFRSHGNRGSTYLFLRWCADQYGADLLPALIGSDRIGVANLEAATHSSFHHLFRGWSVALAGIALGSGALDREVSGAGFRSLEVRGAINDHRLSGPRIHRVVPGQGRVDWDATGTSSRFMIVEGGDADAVEVTVAGPREAAIQVTSIPLPGDLPSLEATASPSYDPAGDLTLRMSVAGRGESPIRLETLAWEPLIPSADSRSPTPACGRLDHAGLSAHFKTLAIGDGKLLRSSPVKLPGIRRESGPYVLKLIGRDAKGRPATAWVDINPDATTASLAARSPDLDDEPIDPPTDDRPAEAH